VVEYLQPSRSRISLELATAIANILRLIMAVLASAFPCGRRKAGKPYGLEAGFAGNMLIVARGLFGAETEFLGIILFEVAAVTIVVSSVALNPLVGQIDALRAIENTAAINWSLHFLMMLGVLGAFVTLAPGFWLLCRSSPSPLHAFRIVTPILGLAISILFLAEQVRGIELAVIGLCILGFFSVVCLVKARESDTRIICVAIGLMAMCTSGFSEGLK
jgi:hypothetical protein